jgi:hypothetical protein
MLRVLDPERFVINEAVEEQMGYPRPVFAGERSFTCTAISCNEILVRPAWRLTWTKRKSGG